jgi:hypothetical protein
MTRTEVVSSNVAEIGYDHETATLEVKYTNGAVYDYFNVPAALKEQLLAAKSIGKFMAQRIKGLYSCEKVDDE